MVALSLLEPLSAFARREQKLRSVREHAFRHPEAALYLGEFEYSVGRVGEALGWFEEAVLLDPMSAVSRDFYSSLLITNGRIEEGYASYRVAREKWPKNWWFLFGPLIFAAYARDWPRVEELRGMPGANRPELMVAHSLADSLRSANEKVREWASDYASQQLSTIGRIDPTTALFLFEVGPKDEAFSLFDHSDFSYRFQENGRVIDGNAVHEGFIFSLAAAKFRADRRFPRLCAKLGLC